MRIRANRYKHSIFSCVIFGSCSIVMLFASVTRPPSDAGHSIAGDGGETQKGAVPAPPAPVSSRYRQFCASCHGVDGQGFGSSAYDEKRGEFVGDLHDHQPANLTCPGIGLSSNEELEAIVRGGISCKTHGQVMPAFPNLTAEQFTEIAEQVRTFANQHLEHDPGEHK
ncbi:MAG TPA: c-type cytochrome [Patescibacteria group bacterium]|jgi:mono/diheme cytochrome c family protein|nr:c-type cytochrome [Patescibacteria group bacterium]